MNDTGVDPPAAQIARLATGYSFGPERFVVAQPMNAVIFPGAGNLYSTTEDMLRWIQGLFDGKLLPAAALHRMMTPFKDGYALGIGVSKTDIGTARDRIVVGHSGNVNGFSSSFWFFPDEKITIVALANVEGNQPRKIVKDIATTLFGGTVVLPSERRAMEVSDDGLKQLTGLYELDLGFNAIVERSKARGRLSLTIGDDSPLDIFAESPTRFFARTIDEQIDFESDQRGAVSGLVMHRDGEEHRGKRLPDRPEVQLPLKTLQCYVGTYQIPGIPDGVVTVENGHLMLEVMGQSKQQLYAESEDHFFLKTVNAQVEFTGIKDGHAGSLSFYRAGRTMQASRR
jgi:hypothetical protein